MSNIDSNIVRSTAELNEVVKSGDPAITGKEFELVKMAPYSRQLVTKHGDYVLMSVIPAYGLDNDLDDDLRRLAPEPCSLASLVMKVKALTPDDQNKEGHNQVVRPSVKLMRSESQLNSVACDESLASLQFSLQSHTRRQWSLEAYRNSIKFEIALAPSFAAKIEDALDNSKELTALEIVSAL